MLQQTKLKLFNVAIDAIFKNWSALQLAVYHDAGWPHSKEKAEWLVGVTENWFYENKDLEYYEVADFLEEIIQNEFHCFVEDGSLREVAREVCFYFKYCSTRDEETVRRKLQSLPKCDLSRCTVENMVTDTEGNSLSLDDDDSPSSSSQSQLPEIEKLSISEYDKQVELRKESKAPEVDEDGFETVKTKTKKKKKEVTEKEEIKS